MFTRNKNKRIFAAILIIGDEILSGRTQDSNTSFLAKWLNEKGIQLKETTMDINTRSLIRVTVPTNDYKKTK